jgi:hypothetical protein
VGSGLSALVEVGLCGGLVVRETCSVADTLAFSYGVHSRCWQPFWAIGGVFALVRGLPVEMPPTVLALGCLLWNFYVAKVLVHKHF